MSTSDGNSTTRPLRRRQSKRFDRSGRAPVVTGSTIISDEDDVELDLPEPGVEANGEEEVDEVLAVTPNDEVDDNQASDSGDSDEPVETTAAADMAESAESVETAEAAETVDTAESTESVETVEPAESVETMESAESVESAEPLESVETASPQPERRSPISPVVADETRNRTLDEMTPCGRCGHDVSTVHIEVDDNILMMESCDNCDTRRWQLAGEPIALQQALDHVGEHTGRRR